MEKKVNKFPVAIGTSLAIERVFHTDTSSKVDKDELPMLDKSDYDAILYNVNTLFNSILNACELSSIKMMRTKALSEHVKLATMLEAEINVLTGISEEHGLPAVFYNMQYNKLPEGFIKRESGSIEAYNLLFAKVLRFVSPSVYHTADHVLPTTPYKRVLIVTHMPFDLLSHTQFSKMDLLERHTGVCKKRSEWGSKYQKINKMDLRSLSFTHTLLKVFGDNSLIKPAPMSVRKEVLSIAAAKRWHPLTTEEKINHDTKRLHGY